LERRCPSLTDEHLYCAKQLSYAATMVSLHFRNRVTDTNYIDYVQNFGEKIRNAWVDLHLKLFG